MIKTKNLTYLENVSLKDYCTFKIGGNAKYLFVAKSVFALKKACEFCNNNNIKFKVIGLGANLLFDDNGFDGCIIINRANKLVYSKNSAIVDSGLTVGSLIKKCLERNLGGYENLAGIPSTIGGAIVNNLGAFDCEFSDLIEYVEAFEKFNPHKKIILTKEECSFSYRDSIFKHKNLVISRAKFNFKQKKKDEISSLIRSAIEKKQKCQPLNFPSAGSVFKRCEIIPSKTIDELGLKGTQIGGAQISPKHAGFIINVNSASSEDVKNLINLCKKKVKNTINVDLQTEIEIVD